MEHNPQRDSLRQPISEKYAAKRASHGSLEARLVDTFKMLDRNANGLVNVNELRVLVNTYLETPLETEEIVDTLQQLLPDKGLAPDPHKSIKLNRDDFLKAMIHFREQNSFPTPLMTRLHSDPITFNGRSALSTSKPCLSERQEHHVVNISASNPNLEEHRQMTRKSTRQRLSRALLNLPDDLYVSGETTLPSKSQSGRSSHSASLAELVEEPENPKQEAKIENRDRSARVALAQHLNSTAMQVLVVFLVLVDAFVVIAELMVLSMPCHVPEPCGLSNFNATETLDGFGQCLSKYEHTCESFHSLMSVLRWSSKGILMFFLAQIICLALCVGWRFFKQPFFVMDLLVVSSAMALEFSVSLRGGRMIVFVLLWRFVRIAHALATTIDIHISNMERRVMRQTGADVRAASTLQREIRSHQQTNRAVMERIQANSNRIANEEEFIESLKMEELRDMILRERNHTSEVKQRVKELQEILTVVQGHMEAKRSQFKNRHIKHQARQHPGLAVQYSTSSSRSVSTAGTIHHRDPVVTK